MANERSDGGDGTMPLAGGAKQIRVSGDAYAFAREAQGYDAIARAAAPSLMADGFGARAEWSGMGAARFGTPDPQPALRITHVGPCLLRGGAEFWLAGLARFLDPRRARVDRCIITMPDQIDAEVASDLAGVPIEVGGAEAVRRAARETDVLICWGTPQLARWLDGCRPRLCVFVAHGEGEWTRDILDACRPVVDHIVSVSGRVRDTLGDETPCTTILNGIDSARLAATRSRRDVRESLGFSPGDFVLGYVGRFSSEKRVHVVLDALASLPAHFKGLLVGWGVLRNSLLDFANERLPGRYAFARASRYLGDYYQAMDAACLVSQEEGFALVMLEAMMCGLPLIATPVGAVPEVVQDKINGLIIPGTSASLRAAVEQLHRHPEWARGVAAEGRTFALDNGHAARMAARYETLLHRLWREKYPPAEGEPEDILAVGRRETHRRGSLNGNGHANGNGHHVGPSPGGANGVDASATIPAY
jgi:glycosyltransferase involved in cell wall biosynthesis